MLRISRRRLLLFAYAALPLANPEVAFSQTICSQQSDGAVNCVEDATVVATGVLTPGTLTEGPGLVASSASDLDGMLTGSITTDGNGQAGVSLDADGLVDFTMTGSVATHGENAAGVLVRSRQEWFSGVVPSAVVVGDVTTSGANSAGIDVSTEGGAEVTCGTVYTTGQASTGVRVVTTGFLEGPSNLTCGDVTASGEGSNGITVWAEFGASVEAGNIVSDAAGLQFGISEGSGTVVVGNVSTTAADADAIYLSASDGSISATCGDLHTMGDRAVGIWTTASDGGSSVKCGNILTEGDQATAAALFEARFELGNLTTLGDGSGGLSLSSFFGSSGSVGNVTTSGSDSTGIGIYYTGYADVTAGNVTTSGDGSRGVWIYQPDGDVVLDVGQIRTSGANSHGIHVEPTNYSNFIDIAVAGVEVSGTGADGVRIDAAPFDFDGISIELATSGDIRSADGAAIRVATLDEFSFDLAAGLEVTGRAAGISVSASETRLDIAGAVLATEGAAIESLGGPATIDIQTTGSIDGFMRFGSGADTVTNAGTIRARGTSDFGGAVDLLTNGHIVTANGVVRFDGLERFVNSGGTIDMQDGAADDRLEISGDYSGSGGATVLLDVSRSLNAADMLQVGGEISGETIVSIHWLDSDNPINAAGVLLVEGLTDPNAITIDGLDDFGLFALAVTHRDGGLYLAPALDAAVVDLSLVQVAASDTWHQSLDAVRSSFVRPGALSTRQGLWGEAYGGSDRSGEQGTAELLGAEVPTSSRLKTNRFGMQIGFDKTIGGLLVGATAGYEKSESDAGFRTDVDVAGFNLGVYAAIGGEVGPYGILTVKHDRLELDVSHPQIDLPELDANITGGDIEAGWRGSVSAVRLELSAGLAIARSKLDKSAVDGTSIDPENQTSVRGRIGGRVQFGGALRPFVQAQLFRDFGEETDLAVSMGEFAEKLSAPVRRTWGRLEAGVGIIGHAKISGWAEFGDRKGWGLRAGLNF